MTEQAAIQAAWTEIAPGYDEYVTPSNMALAEGPLQRARLRPDMRVLDVAAGSGGLSIPAARAGAQVLATDVSPAMVERLETRAREEGLTDLKTRVMDGHALDLGTGSGIWGIELAKRGWDVTGIDNVERALSRARDRVEDADVEMELVYGDVTNLGTAGIDDEFQLGLDTGTFHGLTRAQREAMAREVDAVAGPDATVLLLVWEPRRRGPLPRGATRDEIEVAFPGWMVTDIGPSQFTAPKPVELLLTPNEHWYRLRRE